VSRAFKCLLLVVVIGAFLLLMPTKLHQYQALPRD
jgi:hypothetical protein